ncbi:hypothetical protein PCASD_00127 [Puccinia coronata f. sp. avenae]|uniref:Uncharacterized protein n=1 Tax=Puccinia coronata f. sp. avenae TaxID=200324 RepID=A0A2N5VQX4_9BASI|nr:hypothetical protein PCASD_00127 [Puccinia coronata f. sp. avenae]
MFDDPDFLDSLSNPHLTIGMDTKEETTNLPVLTGREASSSTTLKVLKRRVTFDAHEWLQKVVRNSMLYWEDEKPQHLFSGQAVIKTISGANPLQEKQIGRNPQVPRKEKKEGLPEKRAAVAEQLGQALCGKHVKGWPGKSTIEVLKKLKITLKVNTDESRISCKDLCMRPSDMQKGHANCVLIALENGWVELISHAPEATDKPNVVGHNPKDNGAGVVISKSFIVGPSKKKHTDSNAIQKNSLRKRKPTSSATGPASKRIKRKKNKSRHLEDLANLDDKEADSNYEGETDRSDSDHDAESDTD